MTSSSPEFAAEDGSRTVAELIVDLLAIAGVTDFFGVAGSTIMPFLDALSLDTRISYHPARHEQSAADMASGYARVSGRLGVFMTHCGPGATNTLTSITGSGRDRVPVLLISGNEESHTLVRRPYHDWPIAQTFGGLTRFSQTVRTAAEVPIALRQALSHALRENPGPVHLDVPEDVALSFLSQQEFDALVAQATTWFRQLPAGCSGPISRPAPSTGEVERTVRLLAGAHNPVLVVGEMAHWSQAVDDIAELSRELSVPYVSTFGARGGVPNSGLFLGAVGRFGEAEANKLFGDADLVIALGGDLSDVDTIKWSMPAATAALVHVHPDADAIDFRLPATVGVVADVGSFVKALRDALGSQTVGAVGRTGTATGVDATVAGSAAASLTGADEILVADTIANVPESWAICMDPGFAALSLSRQSRFLGRRFLYSHGFGYMGFAVPAAAGAVLSRRVDGAVAIVGDGSFFMSLSSLETIGAQSLPVHCVVVDDGGFGSQRQKQRQGYGGRVMGVDYENPDIAGVAQSLGCEGRRVVDAEAARQAARAIASSARPSVTVVSRERDQQLHWYEGSSSRR